MIMFYIPVCQKHASKSSVNSTVALNRSTLPHLTDLWATFKQQIINQM